MNLGRNSAVLDQPAVAEFYLQNLRLGIVAGRADLARVDAFSFHGHSSDTVTASPERTEASPRGSPSTVPSALPSTQKQTEPGGTTCFASRSSTAVTGISK